MNKQKKNQMKKNMRNWFNDNYINLDYLNLLIDIGCIWSEYGCSSAIDILKKQYEKKYPIEYVNELGEELDKETKFWVLKSDDCNKLCKSLLLMTFPIDKLNSRLKFVRRLAQNQSNNPVKDFSNNLLLIGSISALESFLYEEFMRQLILDESKLDIFIENKKEKLKIENENLSTEQKTQKVFCFLKKIIWHQIETVNKLYNDVLGVCFIDKSKERNCLPLMIEARHSVVHSFGYTREGGQMILENRDIEELCEVIIELANFIAEKTSKQINKTLF